MMQLTGEAAPTRWSLTQDAFDSLLASLGPDRNTAAEEYVRMRRNLVRLFEWRGCSTPDEYADETINRCARKIQEGQEIRDLPTYSIGVARMLVLEMNRDRARQARLFEEGRLESNTPHADREDNLEARVECLQECLAQLTPQDRDLILNYYQGDKAEKINARKQLMSTLKIPASTLRMRALRVREKLQLSAETYLREKQESFM